MIKEGMSGYDFFPFSVFLLFLVFVIGTVSFVAPALYIQLQNVPLLDLQPRVYGHIVSIKVIRRLHDSCISAARRMSEGSTRKAELYSRSQNI
jgi:hypothetical protein